MIQPIRWRGAKLIARIYSKLNMQPPTVFLARSQPKLWQSLILFGLLTISVSQAFKQTSCLDDNGNPVDWFLVYKFPKSSSAPAPFNTGFAYAYMTSSSVELESNTTLANQKASDLASIAFLSSFKAQLLRSLGTPVQFPKENNRRRKEREEPRERQFGNSPYWIVSEKLISDPSSLVFRTLGTAYKNKTLSSIFYSDQPPRDIETGGGSGTRAHAKGAVIMDDHSDIGVWLTHSVPNFPPPRSMELKFEKNASQNGQTFMCISFELAQSGEQVIEHLINMFPLVYDSNLSQRLHQQVPNLAYLTLENEQGRKTKANKKQGNLAQTITTPGGQSLRLYSKSSYFRQDIYSDWMDEDLNSNLYVASWRLGAGGKKNSSCPPAGLHVNNVQDFKLEASGDRITWPWSRDHSKWAISASEQSGIVCIADINRVESQFKRGGGAVCIKCPQCWKAFSSNILDLEPCPLVSKKSPTSPADLVNGEQSDSSKGQIDWKLLARLKRDFLSA